MHVFFRPECRNHLFTLSDLSNQLRTKGASQIKGFRPMFEKTFPSIYRIFRASQNTNRWRIIGKLAKSQPLDARVMFFRQVALFRLVWPSPNS